VAFMDMPPPLKPEVTIQLLKDYKAGDEGARDKVAEGNLRLVMYCARKFENTGILLEDLASIGMIGLMKAIDTFKVDKLIKFATYAARCINNEILMALRKQKKINATASLEDVIANDWDGNELTLIDVVPDPGVPHFSEAFVRNDNLRLIKEAMDELNDQERQAVTLRLLEGLTQKQAARIMGISQSYVSRLATRAVNRIKKMISLKEEKDMAIAAKGNRQRAIQMLKDTTRTYKEISDETGVPLGSIAPLALQYRPEHVRRELASKNAKNKKGRPKKNVEVQVKKERTMPRHIPTEQEAVEEALKGVELPTPAFFNEVETAGTGITAVEQPTLGEAIQIFREEMKEELRKEVLEEMNETSKATQPSDELGVINRKVTFSYEGDGSRIPVDVFVEELESLISNLRASGNKAVNFSLEVKAQ
jgi:RNA polymerase sporulation-specific sigma factor